MSKMARMAVSSVISLSFLLIRIKVEPTVSRRLVVRFGYAFIWDMTSSAKLSSRFCRPSPIS